MSFNVKWPSAKDERGKSKPKPKWHAYNLIPQVDEFGSEAEQYEMKMICWEVALGIVSEYKVLYEQTIESEVWEMYGLYLAKLYPTS